MTAFKERCQYPLTRWSFGEELVLHTFRLTMTRPQLFGSIYFYRMGRENFFPCQYKRCATDIGCAPLLFLLHGWNFLNNFCYHLNKIEILAPLRFHHTPVLHGVWVWTVKPLIPRLPAAIHFTKINAFNTVRLFP